MQFMSWASTLPRARRSMLTARATLVSRYSPSGIMPMRAATMEITASWAVRSRKTNSLTNRATPMGTSRMPMTRMSLSREDIISLLPTVTSFLASVVRRAA